MQRRPVDRSDTYASKELSDKAVLEAQKETERLALEYKEFNQRKDKTVKEYESLAKEFEKLEDAWQRISQSYSRLRLDKSANDASIKEVDARLNKDELEKKATQLKESQQMKPVQVEKKERTRFQIGSARKSEEQERRRDIERGYGFLPTKGGEEIPNDSNSEMQISKPLTDQELEESGYGGLKSTQTEQEKKTKISVDVDPNSTPSTKSIPKEAEGTKTQSGTIATKKHTPSPNPYDKMPQMKHPGNQPSLPIATTPVKEETKKQQPASHYESIPKEKPTPYVGMPPMTLLGKQPSSPTTTKEEPKKPSTSHYDTIPKNESKSAPLVGQTSRQFGKTAVNKTKDDSNKGEKDKDIQRSPTLRKNKDET